MTRAARRGERPRYRWEVEEVTFSGTLQEAGRGGHVVVVDQRLAPSLRREHIHGVLEAKRPETRERRIAKSIATLEGRNDP